MRADLRGLRERILARSARLQPDHPSYPWMVLLAVMVGTFMAVLDGTIVNVGLAKFEVVFGASTDAVQWVITAYMLTFGILLAASGWIADRFGYKRTFLFALALFIFGSFLCSRSWSIGSLIVFRVVQGIGGGLIQPVGMAMVTREFPPERRGVALGFWSIAAAASLSLGPTVGGWIIDNISWHWIFDVNVPIGIVGILVGYIILREHKVQTRAPFDLLGFASLVVFLTPLLLALSEGTAAWNTEGWRSPFILASFGVSGVGLAVFLITELTTDHPLVNLRLFKSWNFTMSSILIFFLGIGMFGSNFLLPLFLQNILGYTPLQAGNVFLPMGLVLAAAAILSGRLTDRIGAKVPAAIAVVLISYGFYRYGFLSTLTGHGYILVNILILGVGMGLFMTPVQATAIASMPPSQVAQASGLINVLRQIGGSFGVAAMSTFLNNQTTVHLAAFGEASTSYAPSFGAVLAPLEASALRSTGGLMSTALARAQYLITNDFARQAYVAGINDVYLLAMAILALSVVPILLLRRTKRRSAASPAPRAEAAA